MKKIFLGLFVAALTALSNSADAQNCYDAYAKKFEERGANEVEDGWHENVVITFRQGSSAECKVGKVKVEKGKITQIYLKLSDGTYQIYTKKFKFEEDATITNGISKTLVTVDDELINIIFIKSIKPPKKKIVDAPNPDDL